MKNKFELSNDNIFALVIIAAVLIFAYINGNNISKEDAKSRQGDTTAVVQKQ